MDYDNKPKKTSKVGEALKRDLEQTKKDITGKGVELNQNAADTIKQATGKESIPPESVPNFKPDFKK